MNAAPIRPAPAQRRWHVERRPQVSRTLRALAPPAAMLATVSFAIALFLWTGKDPLQGLRVFFLEPMNGWRAWSELGLKMTPLLLVALGLTLCYRANVWNIGAEGQLIVGATLGGAAALLADADSPRLFFVIVMAAGAIGGTAWGAVIAWLRDRFNANEILVSLMLTYIAQLLLMYLVHGPLKDPNGYNFPYSATFEAAALIPRLFPPARLNLGFAVALFAALAVALFLARTHAGYRLLVAGAAPRAAAYAGFSSRQAIWVSLLACGALSGVAGAIEVAGPIEQLTPSISPGYGFAAIIVAWLGRLSPAGCILASFVMSVVYIGGELAQSRLGLPNAISGVLQGILLLSLLTADALIEWRVVRRAVPPPDAAKPSTVTP